jgi:hypothetical protein
MQALLQDVFLVRNIQVNEGGFQMGMDVTA